MENYSYFTLSASVQRTFLKDEASVKLAVICQLLSRKWDRYTTCNMLICLMDELFFIRHLQAGVYNAAIAEAAYCPMLLQRLKRVTQRRPHSSTTAGP
ncbi:hypothetical protein [uncultured Chitinophaga sp.]|uniref:hypothetical protein n=1 Tax=uncultured Chitinophaga sp. TaxID=339340 RepID=UPI0025EF76C9|nr:hypothetical protein [uncultured Chitinophaga sp.]